MTEIEQILDVEQYLADTDAVIFDLDDTLYPEKDYVRSGYKKVADMLHRPEFAAEMWAVFERGGKAIDEVLEKNGLSDYKNEALNTYRLQNPDIRLYDGVAEMLERLKKSGKKLGIITDGRPEGQRAKLKALDVQVDVVIITDELGGIAFRKPNQKAFEIMQEKMDIPYEKMVYIGDNARKDFVAPQQLGMGCIWYRNPDGLY